MCGNEYTHTEYYKNGYEIDSVIHNDGYLGKFVMICIQEWKYFKKVVTDE
jgi:hypothetical protein